MVAMVTENGHQNRLKEKKSNLRKNLEVKQACEHRAQANTKKIFK